MPASLLSPCRPPVALKSAKDIELTESEEEEESTEEEDDGPVPERRAKETKRGPDPFAIFLVQSSPSSSPSSVPEEKQPAKKKEKSTGLMLAFPEPSIKVAPPKEPQGKNRETVLAMESPNLLGEEKRERKKKKSKKSKQREVEDIDTGSSGPVVTRPAASDDPFGLTSSLDAWLNAGQSDAVGTN